MIINYKNNYRDLFLVAMLLAVSTFAYFIRSNEFVIILFIIALYYFSKGNYKVDNFIYIYIFMYIIIQLCQYINFNILSVSVYMGLHIRILLAYFIVKIVNKRFVQSYIDIIYIFGCISVFFYLSTLLFPWIAEFFINNITPYFVSPFEITNNIFNFSHNSTNIIIFNFHGLLSFDIPRNSGPYWEPGVNAGMSILALLSNSFNSQKMRSKKNSVFIFNIITSFSTTGYFLLFLFIIFKLYEQRNIIIFAIPIFLLAGFLLFNRFDFLREKIDIQLSNIQISNSGYSLVKTNRFASAIVDFNDFLENPLFGMGRDFKTRIKGFNSGFDYSQVHRNNGVTNYLVSYGIFIFVFYFYCIKKSYYNYCEFKGINKNYSWFFLIMILVMGFSELYFRRPFFISLSLMFLIYRENEIDENLKKK